MKKIFVNAVFARIVASSIVTVLSAAGTSTAQADDVDDFVRGQMESKHIPGIAFAVVKGGKAVKVRGYGLANLESETPVTPETVFRIGSVSKQIIATAIMMLANEGKLSLDEPAAKFLDGAPPSWNDITIRRLLTHTSGLVREAPGFNALKVQSDAELIKSAYATPLVFKTGEKWQYSNLGYFVLAEIVAKVSGKSWSVFMEERIFTPLAMNASGIVDNTPVVPHRADGYVYRSGQYQNAAMLLALRPSGAFMSSLNDMLKWNAALDAATLLPQKVLNEMWTEVALKDGSTYPYGFGFQIERFGSHRAISHGGSLTGFRSWYLRLPDDNVSVIVLTNNEIAPTDAIAAGIAARYIKGLFPTRKIAKLATAELEALVGSYRLQGGSLFSIAREGEGLQMGMPGGMSYFLLPNSSTLFSSPDDPRIHLEFDRSGPVTRLAIFLNNAEQGKGAKQ